MTKVATFLITSLTCLQVLSSADAHAKEHSSIRHLVVEYAELHQTNFVLSPKLNSQVEITKRNVEAMSIFELESLLSDYGIIAIQKNDAIYLYTKPELEQLSN